MFQVMRNGNDRIDVEMSDQGWVRKTSGIEGALLPGLSIKAFEPQEVAEAERWLHH